MNLGNKIKSLRLKAGLTQEMLANKTFEENVEFLHQQLAVTTDKAKIYNFLAHVYHHRMVSDSSKVSTYVRKALTLNPNIKNCQWLLQKAEGAAARDWNVKNHCVVIDFYKKLVKDNPEELYNYLELIKCYDKMLAVLEEAFGFTEGELIDVVVAKRTTYK